MVLEGAAVRDLTELQPDPFCVRITAYFGAEAMKRGSPGGDLVGMPGAKPGQKAYSVMVHNRNKRGVVLNLKEEEIFSSGLQRRPAWRRKGFDRE